MKKIIATPGETIRLLISDATLDQCQALQEICHDWDDRELMEGEKFEPDYIYKCLTVGDVPPLKNASRSYYKIKSIQTKATHELIGFIEVYHGYPDDTTLWISMFVIRQSFRGNGYAREVINFINSQGNNYGYLKTGIGVYLKNTRAMNFWTSAGFKVNDSLHQKSTSLENAEIQYLHFAYVNSTFE